MPGQRSAAGTPEKNVVNVEGAFPSQSPSIAPTPNCTRVTKPQPFDYQPLVSRLLYFKKKEIACRTIPNRITPLSLQFLGSPTFL